MASFFDGLLNATQNPLFLGGANLLMGGGPQGMMQGMQMGNQMQQQRRQQEAVGGVLSGMNMSEGERQFFAANPEAATQLLSRIYAEKMDPMAATRRRMAEAQLKQTELENQMFPLRQRQIEAQIAQSGQGSGSYGKAGTVLQGPDGKFYSVQFGEDGRKLVEPLAFGETPLAPSRGVDVVGDQMFDKATGAPVRSVGENIEGAETAKIVGRETGEGRMALPKMARSLESYEQQASVVDSEIEKAKQLASSSSSTTGFVGAGARFIPGTTAYDLGQKLLTIKANIGFDTLREMRDNSPTGGALGQVAVQEMQALQSVVGSLDQAQSEKELVSTLNQIKAVRQKFRAMRRRAYKEDVARFGAGAVPNPETAQPSQSGDGWQEIEPGIRIREKR